MPREKTLSSPDYWFVKAQNELFRQFHYYMEEERINQTQLADRLGISKGRVSQILRGESNFTMKKLIELSLSIRKIAKINYIPIEQEINEDALKKFDRLNAKAIVKAISEKKTDVQLLKVDKFVPFDTSTHFNNKSIDSTQVVPNTHIEYTVVNESELAHG